MAKERVQVGKIEVSEFESKCFDCKPQNAEEMSTRV